MRPSIRPSLTLAALIGLSAATSVAHAEETLTSSTTTNSTSANVPTSRPGGEVATVSDPGEPRSETTITRRTFPNRPLLATGSVLLVGSYVPAVIGAAVSSRDEDEKMYIPVAGPWMTLTRGETETTGQRTLLVADGVVQGVGALMMLTSFVIPERTTHNWYLIGQNDKLQIAPQQMRAGFGLGASGRF